MHPFDRLLSNYFETPAQYDARMAARRARREAMLARRKATLTEVNPRPDDANERNDCSVRAWSVAAQVPYTEAHAAFKAAGRQDRKGTSLATTWKVQGPATQEFQLITYGPRKADTPTLAAFLRTHPTGRYVVHIKGHAFAVVDGMQADASANGLRCRVQRYWKVS